VGVEAPRMDEETGGANIEGAIAEGGIALVATMAAWPMIGLWHGEPTREAR
jgi:hypothetical protein